jgi:hypothetical protein
LEFHQNKCHPRDVPDKRRQRVKATDQWAQGVASQPGFVGLARGFMHTCLHEKEKAKEVEKVGGGQTTWLAGHVARPASHHFMSY